jgi:hypothetical protein
VRPEVPAEARRDGERRDPPGAPGRSWAGIALSLLLHAAAAWAVLFGGDSVRELPSFLDEPVEVVLVDWPAEEAAPEDEEAAAEEEAEEEEAGEEADAAPPPLPEVGTAEAEPPVAEEPEPEAPEPEATEIEVPEPEVAALPEPAISPQATPRVLIPVTEFAEEDGGSAERAGETGLREGLEEASGTESEEPPAQTPAETDDEAPGEGTPSDDTGEGPDDGPGAADGEDAAPAAGVAEGAEPFGGETEAARDGAAEEVVAESKSESEAEADSGAGAGAATPGDLVTESEADTAGEPDLLAVPGEGPGEVAAPASGLPPADTRARPREKPAELAARGSGERIDLAALADLGARAEAVSRALAARRSAGGGGEGGGGRIAGGVTATRLFSRDISDDPRMRTAMNGMPQAARVDLLCMTELRAQLRTATPPYHADLLPSFRFEAGNVLQPRRAAFRAGGQWYELAFRCELDAGVTRVESFTYRVGEPVPRAEWSARGFPGN